jgi:hypothetical protein
LPSQSPKPVSQVVPQRPIAHVGVALGPAAQVVPQPPQFIALTRVSTSHPLLALPSPSAKPSAHRNPQRPIVQTAVALGPALHAAPQVPQCSASFVSVRSQPLAALLSQSPMPVLHAATVQRPIAHPDTAPGSAHIIPQVPQLVGSLCVRRHVAPQQLSPVGHA